jgi:outer membrane protein assembly factor BamB/TolA-binding protein
LSTLQSLAIVLRGAILTLLLSPTLALAQAVDGEPEKLSNDQPSRPLQMPAASSETKEAFDDFERFVRRGAWERATKALYAIPEAQATRFVDGPDGFIIPVARKRRAVLAGLSPEGQAAYRLFYDADAKKLLDQAEGPAEQATLETLYSSYFLTSVGDNAADRLGDLYFEQGRFDHAAECWLAVFRERPDSELSPALMAVKAALALAKAGRRAESEAIRKEVAARYADEVVTIGGRKAKAAEHLRLAPGDAGPGATPASAGVVDGPPPALAEAIAAVWQLRFGASVTAGMTPPEATQWEANTLSGAVPAVAIEGSTLYANYLGHVFALDLTSGKMLWRSASFHNLEINAMQGQARMLDPKRFAILAAPGYVWSLGRDLKEVNSQAPARLICRRAETGEVVWQSTDLPDYAGLDLVGLPILVRGTLYLAGKTTMNNNGQDNTPRQFALAIRPHDGKVLWKTEVGMFREAQQFYYYAMPDTTPQPRLAYRAGSVYMDTHAGVLARLDAESGRLDWGYGYPTEPVQGQSRFFFFGGMQNQAPTPSAEPPLQDGDALLVKGAKADRICAVDPDRMKVLWDRPIAKTSRLLGVDDRTVYLGGPDLGALDRKTRALRWSTPMPGGSEDSRVLLRPDGLWQLTPRGIFEVDPGSGRVRRIFRGEDVGASGGDLILTDRWLLAISNRTISAYPRGAAGADRAAGQGAATKTGRTDD